MSKGAQGGRGHTVELWGTAVHGWVDHRQADSAGCLIIEVQPNLHASKDVPMLLYSVALL